MKSRRAYQQMSLKDADKFKKMQDEFKKIQDEFESQCYAS